MRKTTHEQNYKVNKEIEAIEKKKEILEPKHTMTELKNSIRRFNNTLDHDLSEKSENTNAEHLK